MRSQVQFPVFKGLFLQMRPALCNAQGYWYRAAFMDGHAARRRSDDFFPAEIGDVEFMSAPSPWPVLHTKDGIRGRDLRDERSHGRVMGSPNSGFAACELNITTTPRVGAGSL